MAVPDKKFTSEIVWTGWCGRWSKNRLSKVGDQASGSDFLTCDDLIAH